MPALLTALVLVDTITAGRRLVVDARLAGVAAAGSPCCYSGRARSPLKQVIERMFAI